jgi:excisionase family DNA binding protein
MDGFLSQREAAEFMRVTVQTLIDWRKKGLTFYKVGGMIRYKKEDLINFMEGCKQNESNTLRDSE